MNLKAFQKTTKYFTKLQTFTEYNELAKAFYVWHEISWDFKDIEGFPRILRDFNTEKKGIFVAGNEGF